MEDRLAARARLVSIVYLSATAGLIVLFRDDVPEWRALVLGHLAGLAALVWIGRAGAGPLRALGHWHPLLLFPLLYKEVELLAGAFGNWGLTEPIRRLESALFGGQPAIYLSETVAFVPLSEYLHFCYFAYLLMSPLLAAYWYLQPNRRAFHELLFLLWLTMALSYLFFVLFPVDSPFYLFDRLEPPLSGQFFYELVHFFSARGGARGGAFPSAHVSGAVVVLAVAWRHDRRVARLLSPIVAGVIVATVYGRFHYALDAIAGLALAAAVIGAYRWHERGGRPLDAEPGPAAAS